MNLQFVSVPWNIYVFYLVVTFPGPPFFSLDIDTPSTLGAGISVTLFHKMDDHCVSSVAT